MFIWNGDVEMIIAHKNDETGKVQTVAQHSIATAEIAENFAAEPFKKVVYNISLLHDVGKYQKSFQDKILHDKKTRVDHSTCGAIEANELFKNNPMSIAIAQYCIAGHHSGLPDGGTKSDNIDDPTLQGRLSDITRFDDYSEYKNELNFSPINDNDILRLFSCAKTPDDIKECFAFITRYCFSCLTDADSLDTANFCTGRDDKELESNFKECLKKINDRLSSFEHKTELQKARSALQQQVYNSINEDSEIYLMNMPTGSGKTICSMKFALERALKTGKRRIIYVIPYNSIIDQTAAVFEDMFGESANILRHQSSFCIDDTDYNEDYKTLLKNVTENWNAQIIITTSVQFFESVYKNKRNRLRKLHNMADSMIIFDEAHMMPAQYLQPCLRAVSFITKLLNSEAVFLTATMPDFDTLVKKYSLSTSRITELITDKSSFDKFRKGDFTDLGELTDEMLLQKACTAPSALIVVNKRSSASKLWDMAQGEKYHLSTYMSAYDRKQTIDTIKYRLNELYKDFPDLTDIPQERKIIVISTPLIEAGVDLDFYTVYRELSGLDSILQAGGRCNREGKRKNARIHIFSFGKSTDAKVNITKGLISKYNDISSQECIKEYYRRLYDFNDESIRENTIAYDCTDIKNIAFASYAQRFNMIDSNTVAVAVECNDESISLIEQLKTTGYTNHRKLQKYTFTVYEDELSELKKQGVVEEYNGICCLTNIDYYTKEKGVIFEAKDYYV